MVIIILRILRMMKTIMMLAATPLVSTDYVPDTVLSALCV